MTALELPEAPSENPVHLWEGAEVEPRAAGTIYKVAISVLVSTLLPRDVMQVTPHFVDTNGSMAPAGLATALATNMTTYLLSSAYGGSIKVYLEDFNPAAPHPPLATATFGNASNFLPANGPRELSLCLSYYGLQNTKRFRGRLYIPRPWTYIHMGTPPASVGERPTAGELTAAMAFATVVLKPGIQPVGMSWCVASHVDKVYRLTTTYWVDDEWDQQRRRGLRGSSRQTAQFP
jgi:hypothetical protein